jgi:uncharacterized membrane protein SirB2
MLEFYQPVKWAHLLAVMCSGSLFFARGIGVLTGQHWPMHALARYLSYTIDTLLLSAALILVGMLPHAVFASGWLTVKLALVVVYVVLGSFALRRARSQHLRVLCFCTAALTFAAIIMIARTHDPLGALRWPIS